MHKQPKHAGRNRDRECISWVVRGMVRGTHTPSEEARFMFGPRHLSLH